MPRARWENYLSHYCDRIALFAASYLIAMIAIDAYTLALTVFVGSPP